ncbi:hypothetical protein [Spirosoma areae]
MASLSNHTHASQSPSVSRSRTGLTLAFLLLALTGWGQSFPLQIQVNVLPPYSAYLQDYPGTGQQVRVLLINTSRNTYQIRLTGQLTGDNGIDIRTSASYRPLRPVTVPPGQTLLSRNDLEGLFDLNQIEVSGIDKNVLARGFPLPDGMYQLCVRAYNETPTNTATTAFGQPLSPEFPLGCSAPIIVRAVEPPILISPLCNNEITATTPQTVVFTWTPPAGVSPAQVDYTLRIVELPQADVDPNVFIDAIALPKSGVQIQNLRTSTFLYGPTQPPLQVGKRYAWRVQAFDRSRKLNFLNDGKSPVCAFTYGQIPVADSTGVFMGTHLVFSKPGEMQGKKLPVLTVGYGNPLYLSWGVKSELADLLETESKSANGSVLNAIPGNAMQKPNNQIALPGQNNAPQNTKALDLTKTALSYRVLIKTLLKGKPFETVLDRQVKTPYLSTELADLPPGIKPGKNYWAEVELVGLTDLQRKTYSLPGGSIAAEPRMFSLEQKNVGNQSDSVFVKGILAFNYPGETGGPHIMPNTLVQLKRVEAGGYENNVGYATTNAQGEFRVAVARWEISKTDTIVKNKTTYLSASINSNGQSGEVTKTTKDTTYYTVGYRVVPANIYLLPAEQTFTVPHLQVGTLDAGTITVLAKGYRVNITARQAYKNWPGAPDVNLAGKTLVLFRKPNKQVDSYVLPVEGQRELYSVMQQSQALNSNAGSGAQKNQQSAQKAAQQSATGTVANPKTSGTTAQKSAANPTTTDGLSTGINAQTEVEKAGYQYVGFMTLQADGSAYKGNLERLLYSYNPLDRYAVYCPDCGQKPDDAETFRFDLPKKPLSPVLARTESYTFTVQTTEAPTVTFKGKLNYKFADAGLDGATVRSLPNTNVRLQIVYRRVGQSMYSGYGGNGIPPGFDEFHKTLNPTLATGKTDKDGNVTFHVKLTKPLKLGELDPVTENGGNNVGQTVQNVYIRTLRVLVDNEYYAHPSTDFGDGPDEQIQPQGSYDLGNLTAKVRSYGLAVNIRTDTTGYGGTQKQIGGIQQGLSGILVYVLRRPLSPDYPPVVAWPKEEGQGLTETYTYNGTQYPVVAKDKTNAEGLVNFTRLVMALDNANSYLIATASQATGINNSKPVELKSVLYNQGWVPDILENPTPEQIEKAKNMGPDHIVKRTKQEYVSSSFGSYYQDVPDPHYWLGYTLGFTRVNENTIIHYGNIDQYGAKQAKDIVQPFADDYTYFKANPISRYLIPGKPSITLRVVDKTNPLQGIGQAEVRLYDGKAINSKGVGSQWSSPDGHVSFTDLKPGLNAILTIEKEGYIFNSYKYYSPATKDTVTMPAGEKLQVNLGELTLGQNVYIDRVLMQPNTRILGQTTDADAKTGVPAAGIDAYVQVDNGLYYKTKFDKGKAFFDAYASGADADSLKIFPVNISYFNEYRLIKNLPKTDVGGGQFIIDAGIVPIYQRDHRIDFILIDKQTGKPVKEGMVKLFGRDEKGFAFGPSDPKSGMVEMQFKNVSVENLFVEVSAPDYVTKTVSVTNTESKTSNPQVVQLEAANLVKGVVVVKGSDGKETPLPGAEVFVAGGSNAPSPYSTTAGPGGSFTLAVGKQLAGVTIQATFREADGVSGSINVDGSGKGFTNTPGQSYTGAIEKNYGLPQDKNASLKLTLTSFNKFKIADIWGFPVKVESLTALANGTANVSGEVELSGSQFGPFAILDPDVRVRFENVVFKPSAGDPTKGEPASVNVPLKTGILDNLGYYSKSNYKPGDVPLYNIRLSATGNFLSGGNLQIVRSGPTESTGVVMAQAQVIDNSFKFSENLLNYEKGQFFLYDPAASGQPGMQPVVVAFRSGGGVVKRTNFGICTKDGQPIQLELLAFKATSSLEGSRLMGDEIHLNPTLTCTLKNANPNSLTVNVGDLVLKNNTVDAKSGKTPLTFNLANKWSVEVRNWVLDYKQGGFYSTEGVVKTGKADIPISLFNLRADFLKLDAQPTETLSLAGLANVKLGGKGYFGYDAATGSDMQGHWAFVVVPDGNKKAGVLTADAKLPGLSNNLEFETISLLDNGEDVFSFGTSSQLVNYYGGVMSIRPKTIETGADYFAIDAGMSTTIPNAPKDVPMRLTYYRPGGNGPVTLKTLVSGGYAIDTKGQVQFIAGQYKGKDSGPKTAFYFADGVMAIRGRVEEKGKLRLGQPGDDEKSAGVVLVHSPLNGGFTYITHDVNIDLNDPQKVVSLPVQAFVPANYKPLQIDLGGKTFGTVRCYQQVKNGQWDLLTFSGIPTGYTMLADEEKNRLTFTNYGSIRAENQKLTADGIGGSNGFPGMTLEYDMAKSRFTGTVTLPPNMPLPPTMTVEQGVAQIRIDGSGFYLAASATVRDVPLIIPVTMKAGLMLGYYASSDFADAEPVLFGNTHRKAMPCAFKQTFKGVFVNGEIPIPIIDDVKFQKSFGFGSVNTGLTAYLDGYVFANYENKAFTFGTGLSAGANFYAYGSVLNVSAGGEINVNNSSQFELSYDTSIKKVTMDAKMNMGAEFKAAVYVDLGIDSYHTSGDVGFCLGMSYPKLSYTIGGGVSVSKPSFTFESTKCTGDCSQ